MDHGRQEVFGSTAMRRNGSHLRHRWRRGEDKVGRGQTDRTDGRTDGRRLEQNWEAWTCVPLYRLCLARPDMCRHRPPRQDRAVVLRCTWGRRDGLLVRPGVCVCALTPYTVLVLVVSQARLPCDCLAAGSDWTPPQRIGRCVIRRPSALLQSPSTARGEALPSYSFLARVVFCFSRNVSPVSAAHGVRRLYWPARGTPCFM